MKTIKQFAILIALISWSAPILYSQSRISNLPKEFNGQEAQQKIPGASFVKEGIATSFPSFVRFEETKKISSSEFIPWLKSTMNSNADVDFKSLKQEHDELGFTHERYQQTFKGVPVENATYVVHVKDGSVNYFNGQAADMSSALSPVPALKEDAAFDAAKKYVGAERFKWEDQFWENNLKERTKNPAATYFPKGELCWYSVYFNTPGQTPSFKLAYRFDISSASPASEKRIYVDANSGVILATFALESNCNGAPVNTIFNGNRPIFTDFYDGTNFRLKDDCQSAEIQIRAWNSVSCTPSPSEIQNTSNTWNNNNNETFGATVLWATRQAYWYWFTVQGRNSYDNAGGDIDGYINAIFSGPCSPNPCCVGANGNNASMSFTGGQLKVGRASTGTLANSFSTLDILAHEYTHAVTGSTAALTYANESGALNESFSDIFAEATENYITGTNDWLLGSERTSGAIRSMSDPSSAPYGDPATYLTGTNWCDYTNAGLSCTMNDAGGVHTNSGVQNKWFYLLSVGGSGTNDNGNTYNISGIGILKAASIAKRNLTSILNNNSNYSDARAGSLQAAVDLFGACSNELKQATNAWRAVGVGAPYFDANAVVTSDYNKMNVSCHDACDGSAAAFVISGISPAFLWSNGATTSSISGLCPGAYTVTVTNVSGLGCAVVTKTVTIINTPLLVLPALTLSNNNGYNISCNGGNDGTASANPSGGTTPYGYSWSDGQSFSKATGLSAGTYSVTVTDVNGCTIAQSATLTQPTAVSTTVAPTTNYNGFNVRCHGGSDGAAAASPSGGVGSFTFNWSNGATTNPATGLSAGTYTVIVTDANGCSQIASTTLTEPSQLTIDAGANKIVYYGYPDSSCAKLQSFGAGGGVPPRTLTWSNGSHAAMINVCPIASTIYYLTITDANGCSATDSVRVCVIDVRCGPGLKNVTICHRTGSATNPFVTICLDKLGAKAHFLNHVGDQLATCGIVKVCDFPAVGARFEDSSEEAINRDDVYLGAFPNPFSGITTIKFKLSENDNVNVKIYDVSGREKALIFTGKTIGGNIYEATFAGTLLSNGIYFLHLKKENGESIVRKLILTK